MVPYSYIANSKTEKPLFTVVMISLGTLIKEVPGAFRPTYVLALTCPKSGQNLKALSFLSEVTNLNQAQPTRLLFIFSSNLDRARKTKQPFILAFLEGDLCLIFWFPLGSRSFFIIPKPRVSIPKIQTVSASLPLLKNILVFEVRKQTDSLLSEQIDDLTF